MADKFAVIDFVENKDEIPVKVELIKRAPDKFFDWYIERFNPFIIKPKSILDTEGYIVKLPIEKSHAFDNISVTEGLLHRTMINLYDLGVCTAIVPGAFEHVLREGVEIAVKEQVMIYFIMNIIEKSLRYAGKALKEAEILVIGSDVDLPGCAVNQIYPHVNYLSVIAGDESTFQYFSHITYEIFDDTGLNLQVFREGKEIMKSADIIIDFTEDSYKNTYYYRKGAVLIDFGRNPEKFRQLRIKREDMTIINNGVVLAQGQKLTLEEYFMYLFLSSREFRSNVQRKIFNRNLGGINRVIEGEKAGIVNLISGNTVLSGYKLHKNE